jgi:hypothetical protein
MQTLMTLARKVGFYASREPNHHIRPQSHADAVNLDRFNEHADVLLLKHDRKIYVDVTVTRPTNQSNLALPAITSCPLLSTRSRTSAKHRKYAEIARVNGYELVAFVAESYGGLSHEAHTLLQTLASHAPEGEESSFLQFAHRCVSVALQSSNAFLAAVGTQMMHTAELRLLGLAKSQMKRRERAEPTCTLSRTPTKPKRRQFSQVNLFSPTDRCGTEDRHQDATATPQHHLSSGPGEPAAAAAPATPNQHTSCRPTNTPSLVHLVRHDPLLVTDTTLLSPPTAFPCSKGARRGAVVHPQRRHLVPPPPPTSHAHWMESTARIC